MTGGAINTVFLRLEGPLQSWGTSSRLVVRDTDAEPSKSGVLGLICCAMGVRREDAEPVLARLNRLRMGVRVDRAGLLWPDYHTVGAGYGNLTAAGRIKRTASTKALEPVVSRRFYLCDASFLVALHALEADRPILGDVTAALAQPRWMLFLGRKACPPAVPIFRREGGTGRFSDLREALAFPPWRPRLKQLDRLEGPDLPAVLEQRAVGSEAFPAGAEVHVDEPVSFLPPVHRPRAVLRATVRPAQIGDPIQESVRRRQWAHANYRSTRWRNLSKARRERDHGLCVVCKRAGQHAHHTTYRQAGREDLSDLRTLCRLCHDAVTILEYGENLRLDRIDPSDPARRAAILAKREEIIRWRSLSQRRRRLKGED